MRAAGAALLAAAALAAGCGGAGSSSSGPVTAYVSAPLTGSRAAEGRALQSGVKRALAAAHGRAGRITVRAVYLDDSRSGAWDIVRTAANARRAAEDVDAIAYIGELEGAATRISLPITNQAEMAQIYPGASGGAAVRSIPGGGYSSRYQPSGEDTFVPVSAPNGATAGARGYAAMKQLLDAIRSAGADGTDRGAVLDRLRG
jgi:ABC-type branched-subunit amino acid transport system substrate-binding protein